MSKPFQIFQNSRSREKEALTNNGIPAPRCPPRSSRNRNSFNRAVCDALVPNPFVSLPGLFGTNAAGAIPLRSSQIRIPAEYTVDRSLNKTVHITEKLRVQLRAEAFNALNRSNINPLDANGNFGSYLPSDAGASSGTMRDSPPRSVQPGIKVL